MAHALSAEPTAADWGNPDPSLTEILHELMPLARLLGFVVLSGTSAEVMVLGHWSEDHCTAAGVLHGGYLMALADAAGAACAGLRLPPGATTSTIASSTNFLRAVRQGQVCASATPVHLGSSTIVVQTDIQRSDARLVARTIQTQAVLDAA